MSYDYNNNQNQREYKEEIRFDENDFRRPNPGYQRPQNNGYNDPNSGYYRPQDNRYNDPNSGYYRPQDNGFGNEFKVREDPPRQTCYAPLIDEAKEKRNFSRIGLGYALFTAVSFAASYLIAYIVYLVNPDFYQTTLFRNLLTPLSLYVFALPVLLIALSGCEAKAPEKKKMKFGVFMLFIVICFGMMNLGAMLGNYVMDYISYYFGFDYSNNLESIIDYDNIWITAIFTVIVAPIGEELVFRKLIIDRTQKYGGFVSIGLSGLIFGLMHGNFYQFFYCFAIGLILGYIYYNTGKLHLTIIIHAVINFVGSVLTTFLAPVSEQLTLIDTTNTEALMTFVEENFFAIIGVLIYSSFTYAAMAAAIALPIIFRKKIRLGRGEISIPKRRFMPIVILNTGVIIMLVFYFLEFGLSILPI